MATFVLVAGAWHGGWCWRRVTLILRAAGHEAYTPTLTGLGERVHLASPDVDFETHVQDVVNVLTFEDLHDVYLLGHSYGGVVTGAAAHRMPETIARLIYLDALLPENGRSVVETYEDYGQHDFVRRVQELVERDGGGWLSPAPAPDSPSLRVTDPLDKAWLIGRLTPQPYATLTTPVRLGNPAAGEIPRTYISCLPHPPGGLIPIFTAQVRDDPAWDYRELQASHDPMITDPQALAEMLVDIAS